MERLVSWLRIDYNDVIHSYGISGGGCFVVCNRCSMHITVKHLGGMPKILSNLQKNCYNKPSMTSTSMLKAVEIVYNEVINVFKEINIANISLQDHWYLSTLVLFGCPWKFLWLSPPFLLVEKVCWLFSPTLLLFFFSLFNLLTIPLL